MSVPTTNLIPGFDDYRGSQVIACSAIFIIVCTVIVALRFYAIYISRRPRFIDDWLMLPALVLMIGIAVDCIFSVTLGGVGRHRDYNILHDPPSLVAHAKTAYAVMTLYAFCIPTEKTAILLLYVRLFSVQTWFRYTAYALIVFIWAWGISGALVAIFQCKPIEYQWTKQGEGTCINVLAFYQWICLPNVIHDVLLLVLPIPSVYKLQISLRKKLALALVFLIGSMGCVASFIRTHYFFQLTTLSDLSWDAVELMSWTTAEPGLILICACMPSLWPLLKNSPIFTSRIANTHGSTASEGALSSRPRAETRIWTNHSQNHGDFIPLGGVDGRSNKDDKDSFSSAEPISHGTFLPDASISITREYGVSRLP